MPDKDYNDQYAYLNELEKETIKKQEQTTAVATCGFMAFASVVLLLLVAMCVWAFMFLDKLPVGG